jgi:SAM-dependent methyltransferase
MSGTTARPATGSGAPYPCPVCGAADSEPFADARDVEYGTSDEVFRYARCPSCESVFLERPPTDRLAEIYPPTYYSFAGSDSLADRIKERLDGRLFRRLLRQLPGARLAVLDVGGGSGWLLTLLRRLDPRVAETHEVDLDAAAGEAARAAGHVFHCTPVEHFASDRQFDLILLLNIVEHLADPAAALRQLAAHLRPGGLMLVKTPNTDTLDRRLFQHANWGGYHCPRHWVLFTGPGFVRLAERCGLACVSLRYTQGAPQWVPSLLGLLVTRGLLHVSPARPLYRHPLFPPLAALMAAVDFVRLPFAKTAQMFVVLRRAERASGEGG